MSLTASMWSSVSGLLAHGERMSVVGNNISNVNTVAFKNQRMDFQDFVYSSIGTAAGPGQVGRGASIGSIMNDFAQGSFEDSARSTDIGILGNGFFMVKPPNANQSYYTRAGNFDFNKDGYLTNPQGYVLQGWQIDPRNSNAPVGVQRDNNGVVGTGAPTDIKLDTFTCPPRHTTNITVPVNLPNSKTPSADDCSTDEKDPFFALLKRWDATQIPALGDQAYCNQSTITVYDEGGRAHKLSIYFDRVTNKNPSTIDGYTDGESYWEYIVTMDPSEDMRDFSSTFDPNIPPATSPDVPEKLKGLLGAGTLTFSSSGTLKDMTAFVPHTDGSDSETWWKATDSGGVEADLTKWVAAPFDTNGYPMFAPNFTGTAGMSQAYQEGNWSQPNPNASGRMISLDFGLRSKTNSWQFMGDPNGNVPGTYKDSGLVTADKLMNVSSAHAQKTGRYKDMYMWEVPGTSYTLLTKDDTMPTLYDDVWGKGSPPNNGTWFEWNIPLNNGLAIRNGGGSTISDLITTQDVEPLPVIQRDAKNPDDATIRRWTANGQSPNSVYADIHRLSPSDPILSPVEFDRYLDDNNLIWTRSASGTPGPGLVTYTANDPAGPSTIVCPDSMTLDDIRKMNWDTSTPTNATFDYYTMSIPGGTPSFYELEIPTGGTADTGTITQTNNDVTEDYWYNGANPDIVLVEPRPTPLPTPTTSPTPGPIIPTAVKKEEASYNGNKYFLNGLDGVGELQKVASTCQGSSFYELNGYSQDGYTFGDLYSVSVNSDGVLSGHYSNGRTLQLYQIVLYDFPSTQNLRREGGNLYTETLGSGVPSSGAPGTGPFGTTQGNSLEQSNVDLAREFVNMITTQRGFQANSKNITTVDTMLETVISMKR